MLNDLLTRPKIDCHAHIYRAIAKLRQTLLERKKLANRLKLDIPDDPSLEGYLRDALEHNIVKVLNLPVADRLKSPEQVMKINDWAQDQTQAFPGRVYTLVAVNPQLPLTTITAELERVVSRANGGPFIKGIKLHPMDDVPLDRGQSMTFQRFDPIDKRFFPLYYYLEQQNWMIYWHCGAYEEKDLTYNMTAEKLLILGRMFPGLRQVGAHLFGGQAASNTLAELAKNSNIFGDLAYCFPWLPAKAIRQYVDIFGAERILGGTDWPFVSLTYAMNGFRDLLSSLRPEEIEMIFFKNAARIFGML